MRRSRLQRRFRQHLESRPDFLAGVAMPMRLAWWERIWLRTFWSPWQEPRPEHIAYAVDMLGLTEADIRDIRYWDSQDMLTIRCWNWRTFDVSGLSLVMNWWR